MTALSAADLDRLYAAPKGRTLAKTLDHIDQHAARFISFSPFCVLATTGADGSVDVSPRGGESGFVKVDGPNRLLLPDRAGNNRLDSFRNLVGGAGGVGLIFFIPGVDETLRVNGVGSLSDDPAMLAGLEEFGKLPRTVLTIAVAESFLHCAKALMRSNLWSNEARVDRSVLPTLGEMIRDQTQMDTGNETQEEMVARYREGF